MIINVCVGVLMYVIILFQTREDASILTSSIVWCYSLYLQWTALSANTDKACNPNQGNAGTTTAQLCAGIFFTFLSLFMISSMSKKDETQAAADGGEAVAETANSHLLQEENDNLQPVASIEKEEAGQTKVVDAKE